MDQINILHFNVAFKSRRPIFNIVNREPLKVKKIIKRQNYEYMLNWLKINIKYWKQLFFLRFFLYEIRFVTVFCDDLMTEPGRGVPLLTPLQSLKYPASQLS